MTCHSRRRSIDVTTRDWRRGSRRGATAVQMLVILVPVLFGMIGFAVDLGILYSVKGELKSAADAMALAAAQKLIGTTASADAATAAGMLTVDNTSGFGNKYYFHGLRIGETIGSLESTIADPAYFATAADALGSNASSGSSVGGALARHVRVTLTGQTQTLFWSFLPIVTNRNVTILASSVAGISAPLCEGCGIEPYALQAVDASDLTDFGFTLGTKYSFAYLCTGGPTPAILPGAAQQVPYLLLNRYDTAATVFADESTQAFRDGAGGLPGSTNHTQSCFRVNDTEVLWQNAIVNACSANTVAPVVTAGLCGLGTRFDNTVALACSGIPDIDALSIAYPPDPDVNDYDTYADYTGNGRRIITIPIVDTLSGTANMTVLGFRQFLLIPAQGTTTINPADVQGRFVAMYIGSVAPLKQGNYGSCSLTAGPGKVVLHQ
jgi:Flp pilus assembly protein TadG